MPSSTSVTHGPLIGAPLRRTEDARLITGQGQYVDDLRVEGTLHAAFVRCPEAHALVGSIDTSDAATMPGVVAVFTAADLGLTAPITNPHPHPALQGDRQASPLAHTEVCYVGEPVAVVIAEDRYQAADAAELVWVDYDPLPAIAYIERAVEPDAPMAHHGGTTNLIATLHTRFGDAAEVFERADLIIPLHLRQHRGACSSMETRGVLAHPDGDGITMYSSTQGPFAVRKSVAPYLGMEGRLRVIAPDVGGGFGPKGGVYAEEYVVPATAARLGRPVKWIETRREHFLTTQQQRDMVADLEVAASADGRFLGLRGRILHDSGAYIHYGVLLPMTGLQLIQGPYTLEAMDIAMDVIATNAVPTSPIRGAARPNAAFLAERAIDAIARATGLSPVDVRRINFIPSQAFPYEYPLPARYGGNITYDSGDYLAGLEAVLELADADGFPARQVAARAEGRRLGIGVAAYVEDTGLGPHEAARVEIDDEGRAVLTTAAASQGQGHATVFAQIVASALGVDVADVIIRAGDTSRPGTGVPTVASRTAVTAGSSTHLAAVAVADQVRKAAAERLEANVADLVLAGGRVEVVGQPGSGLSFAELAAAVVADGGELAADEAHPAARPPYASGCHVAEVEVDELTGLVTILNYSVAHDCGTVLNPMIVDGQIDGGVAHGLSNALLERVVYSDDGQLLTSTYMDFRIPTALEMPPLSKVHVVTPAPDNPLGAKGAGEGGTIPAMAAVAAAVENALADLGVVVDRYPLTPDVVRAMIEGAAE